MNVLVAGIVKEIDIVILEDQVQDDEGNDLSVLAKSIVLDNNKSYLATGNIDVEVGQEVCFHLKEDQDKIIRSIKKDEVDSLKNNFMAKRSLKYQMWKKNSLISLPLILISALFVNDSLHRYLSSNDPAILVFLCIFCFCLCFSTFMSSWSFSKWKKEKEKNYLSSEDNETLEKFKSSLLKESETEAINIEIKEVHHV